MYFVTFLLVAMVFVSIYTAVFEISVFIFSHKVHLKSLLPHLNDENHLAYI